MRNYNLFNIILISIYNQSVLIIKGCYSPHELQLLVQCNFFSEAILTHSPGLSPLT